MPPMRLLWAALGFAATARGAEPQLRGAAGQPPVAAGNPPSTTGAAAAGVAAPGPEEGLPGGWGEAAKYATEADADSSADNATLGAMWDGGSCRSYGCINDYARENGCQCNSACTQHNTCCSDYVEMCAAKNNVLTLYHTTSQDAANVILQSGFKPGHSGWCGGGIYFAMSAAATATKAIGPESHQGVMLQAEVDLGRILYEPKNCGGGHTSESIHAEGYDSVSFDPGDGPEFVVYEASRVLSVKQIPA